MVYLGSYTLARSNFSGFEKVLSVFSPISGCMTGDGYLIVPVVGQTNQYVGIEQGLLQECYDPYIRLAYLTDPDGQAYLLPSAPLSLDQDSLVWQRQPLLVSMFLSHFSKISF